MKMNKVIGTSLLCASLLALGACGSNQSAPSNQQQQSTSNQSSEGSGNASLNNGSSQNKDSGQSGKAQQNNNTQSSQNQSSKQNKGAAGNDGSAQNGNANQGGGAGSTDQKSNPTSMKMVAAALNTRVPLMLPSNVPVTNGKYLSATTKSETWYYNTHLYETDHPTKINSSAASQGTPIATVEGTEYKNDTEAQNQIGGYLQVHPAKHPKMSIDLGHGIKALGDAGAGHSYITWNEGRWCLKIDSPNDPKYQTQKYHDSKKLARDMVSYLENHALPAPQRIGVISVRNWNNGMETTIHWQYHEMTYKVTSKDPLQALKVAVQMSFQK